ncbi:hypothetical protein PPL_12020 [Heterostelium album PN500]|uniref:Uncharacterized protein n=1 Tax=Heterostelium pallidum (strain ATCC 26659 / Pp 5 / PN500) TaxID=670386 RepID=D3BV48_HETP5|nr:hypothetical protein PPL_12020 [Heterostelium album PN500]EFA74986.1 hypothetical protein PPL_12020 [Heterostelium album PN500]|eukprot:XP_020427120.1 hypothetical protein PPL_12020 [Heterostelium album PN500]
MIGFVALVICITVLFVFTNNKRNEMNKKQQKQPEVDLRNKVIVITGANAGLGKEIALRLAARQAHIIMACRTERKARDAVAESKMAQICSTYELHRRVEAYAAEHPDQPRLTINSVHPGIFASEIVDLPFPLKNLYHAVFKSAAYCSEFIIESLVASKFDRTSGKYFDHGKTVSSSSSSYDTVLSSQLYTQSLQLLSTHFNIDQQSDLTKLILK